MVFADNGKWCSHTGGALSSAYAPRPSETPEGCKQDETDRWMWMQLALKEMLKLWIEVHFTVECKPIRPKQSSQLPSETFLSTPICFPLFHRLKSIQTDVHTQWMSMDALAEALCLFFNDRKDDLLDSHFDEDRRREWRTIMADVTSSALKGHINFMMTEGKTFDEGAMMKLTTGLTFPPEPSSPSSEINIDQSEASNHNNQSVERPSRLPTAFCIPLNRKRSLEIVTVPNAFIQEEYELYRKYQMIVHGDSPWQCSSEKYEQFLVNTPLMRTGSQETDVVFGSFHMQYRIDGRLVAVAVVDILPRCLSSKYFFWDPDFAPLSLGKISALKEIEWVRTARIKWSDLKYYYMGYYIHSCPKMRYKGDYAPSELLCPESYLWIKLTEDVRAALDGDAYVNLAAIAGAECRENEVELRSMDASIRSQSILTSDRALSLGAYLDALKQKKGGNTIGVMLGFDRGSQSKQIDNLVKSLTRMIVQWRRHVRNVADQLTYDIADNEEDI